MADRRWKDIKSKNRAIILESVSFLPNDAGVPTMVSGTRQATVARSSVGVYTVDFDDTYSSAETIQVSLQNTAGEVLNAWAVAGATVAGEGTVQVLTISGSHVGNSTEAALHDFGTTSDVRVNVSVRWRNSPQT